ncbi:MAG: hypothetical protein NWP91_04160, partial [Rickettsiaceae bacterium]|nr:hypothetical protein [Rickettsiaceae bacterium]
ILGKGVMRQNDDSCNKAKLLSSRKEIYVKKCFIMQTQNHGACPVAVVIPDYSGQTWFVLGFSLLDTTGLVPWRFT